MKKIRVLSFYRENEQVTNLLQDIGVIHPVLHPVDSDSFEELEVRSKRIDRAIEDLKRHTSIAKDSHIISEPLPIDTLLSNIESIRSEIERLSSEIEISKKDKVRSEPWGSFDPDLIEELNAKGVRIRYFEGLRKKFQRHNFSDTVCQPIHFAGDKVYFVVVEYHQETASIPFDEIEAPLPVAAIDQKIADSVVAHKQVLDQIHTFLPYLAQLEKEREKVSSEIEYRSVQKELQAHGNEKIDVITGWLPAKEQNKVLKALDERRLTYQLDDPAPGDTIPVILRNNAYTRIFETITKVFQLPGYYELDLTPIIAVFYPIFFAYCLGDAGYGVIVLGASIAAWFTFMKNSRSIAALGIILGVLTTLMGIVKSGSVFGLPLVDTSDVALFSFMSQFVLVPDDQTVVFNAFNVALMLGVLQIFVGIISSIINKIIYDSFQASLGQFGKLFIVIGVLILFLADMREIEVFQPYSAVATVLLYVGIAMVLLFHDINVSLVPRISSGILPLFFIFTGILGDILSYVRLFALGVASSVLGLVVNQIGMQIMGDSIPGIIGGVIFLVFGHTLNLALAILGAFVHPLRLTFVEFYNNAQFKGGGIEYKPFRKLNNELKKE